jgi:hypothetical protein
MLRQRAASFAARREVAAMAGVVALSWLGNYIHNVADLPQLTPLSPENSLVALATLGLFIAWWQLTRLRRATTALLLGWGLTHLIGGAVLSVLPIGLFPFDPEQSLRHYLFHLLYGAMQLPLIALAFASVRAGIQG